MPATAARRTVNVLVRGRGGRGEQVRLVEHAEVGRRGCRADPVVAGQGGGDLRLSGARSARRARLHHELLESGRGASAGEVVLHRGEGDHRHVVLVLEAVRALGLQHADHLQGRAAEHDVVTDRVGVGAPEQVGDDGRAEHDDLGVVGLVVGGDEPSELNGPVLYRGVDGVDADEAGRRVRAAVVGGGGARVAGDGRQGGGVGDVGLAGQGGDVLLVEDDTLALGPVAGPRPRAPNPPVLKIVRVLVPSEESRAATAFDDPLPTATTKMTAPTPIIMPSMVSADRSRLARMPWRAIRKFSRFIRSTERQRGRHARRMSARGTAAAGRPPGRAGDRRQSCRRSDG